MARAYQVSCPPGSVTTIAGPTMGNDSRVNLRNGHASEGLYLGGDENELRNVAASVTLSSSTGYLMAGNSVLSATLTGDETIYGRAANATVTITCYVFSTNIA